MELRIYPEYVGDMYSFQMFLLKHFKTIHYCIERHSPDGQEHIHALLLDPVKPINCIQFRRLIQRYKRSITKIKFRNHALHIDLCCNDVAFIEYLKATKPGGYKQYYYLHHPYPFID